MPIEAESQSTSSLRYIAPTGLLKLALRNALLNVLTFGLYRFWGRTRWRQKMWSSVELRGDRFEYSGTGFELFKGFVITLVVMFPLLVAYQSRSVS